jgi:hypothetical protein
VNEKHDKISASIRLSQQRVNVLTRIVSILNKTLSGLIEEYLFNLVFCDVMFDRQFVHNVWQPDEITNFHKQLCALIQFLPRG